MPGEYLAVGLRVCGICEGCFMGFAGQFSGMPIWNFAWGPGIRWGWGDFVSGRSRGVGGGGWALVYSCSKF